MVHFVSKKMVALKRAYAEIILNTAKEAAARVMASERRALRCQHDLNAAKDEALQLLIRLKKMIDAKVLFCWTSISLWFKYALLSFSLLGLWKMLV